MSDIVEKLRSRDGDTVKTMDEAADLIERQAAEIKQLRERLIATEFGLETWKKQYLLREIGPPLKSPNPPDK